MRGGFIFILVLFSTLVYANDPLKIGLFHGQEFLRASFTVVKGQMEVVVDGEALLKLQPGDQFDMSTASGQLCFIKGELQKKSSSRIVIRSIIPTLFKIQIAGFKATQRLYEGDLLVTKVGSRLQLTNILPLENYVSGVVEAEGGARHTMEYYKVQCIISRTYATANLRRHEAEGFHLCDATHCQVYHGVSRHEPLIKIATQETEDIVIVDQNIDLITAAFHSNCGGHTNNAEDVWSKPLSYCIGKKDTFCLVMPNSNWEKSVEKTQWMGYLNKKKYPLEDSSSASAVAYFPSEKELYFADSSLKIPNKVIRQDFKLKSAYFSVHQNGDKVTFIGQGFGHGVGLCQEGAIRMASLGYTYKDIIHFYYTDVHLIPLRFRWFFAAE